MLAKVMPVWWCDADAPPAPATGELACEKENSGMPLDHSLLLPSLLLLVVYHSREDGTTAAAFEEE